MDTINTFVMQVGLFNGKNCRMFMVCVFNIDLIEYSEQFFLGFNINVFIPVF